MPNFFMRPEKLAESMRKLRLAATLPYRNKDGDLVVGNAALEASEHKDNQKDAHRQYLNSTMDAKVNINKPPPLQTSEINRIASIFSSKFN